MSTNLAQITKQTNHILEGITLLKEINENMPLKELRENETLLIGMQKENPSDTSVDTLLRRTRRFIAMKAN